MDELSLSLQSAALDAPLSPIWKTLPLELVQQVLGYYMFPKGVRFDEVNTYRFRLAPAVLNLPPVPPGSSERGFFPSCTSPQNPA